MRVAEAPKAHDGEPPGEPTESPESPEELGATPEPQPEPNGPEEPTGRERAPLTEQEIEARMRKLDSEAERHYKRVEEVLAEDVTDFRRCPACLPFAPGYLLDQPLARELLDAIVADLSGGDQGDYATAEDASVCETCRGLGKVLTGSLVPEHRTKLCAGCNGCGYRVKRANTPPPPPAPSAELIAPTPEPQPTPPPERDPWGRDRTDPNFGRMPGYEA